MIFAQEIKTDSILTEKQNAEWISEFEKLNSIPKKIVEIKVKIINDTLFNRIEKPCKMEAIKLAYDVIEARYSSECQCKILFILSFKKFGYILNPLEYPKTSEILELINDKNIDEIKVYKGDDGARDFGTKGRCGVVVLNSKNRKLKRKVKNVL
jgi:hypothetical protein